MDEKNLKEKIMLDLLLNRFQFISNSDNAVEAKVNALLGFSVAISLVFLVEKFPEIVIRSKQIEAGLGIVFLIASALIAVFVILSRKYHSGVVREEKIDERLELADEEFLSKSISDLRQSVNSNSKILKDKTKAFKFSVILFIIGVCLLILSSFSTICF